MKKKDVAKHYLKCSEVWKKYEHHTEDMDKTQWYSKTLFQDAMVDKGHPREKNTRENNQVCYYFVSWK